MDTVYSDDIWHKSGCRQTETKTLKVLDPLAQKCNYNIKIVDLVPEEMINNGKTTVTDNFLLTKHIGLYPEFYGSYYYQPAYINRPPYKLFSCFINRADYFRQSWLYQFIRQGIFDQGAVSYRLEYRDEDIPKEISSDPTLLFEHLFIGNEIFYNEHEFLKNCVPFATFDTTLEQAIIDSKISLVIETYFDKTHGVAFSEKIFRNLLLPRPFLLFNNPGAVQHLRRCGFDVFDDIVDHSYDDIVEGVPKQIHMLEQIRNFDSVEYSSIMVERLEEGCKHNTSRLLELKSMWPERLKSVIKYLENH